MRHKFTKSVNVTEWFFANRILIEWGFNHQTGRYEFWPVIGGV